jgi:hypothetical protein
MVMRKDSRRPPDRREQIIEVGIFLALAFGARRGALFLAARGVSDRTIVRVLCEPAQRRSAPR